MNKAVISAFTPVDKDLFHIKSVLNLQGSEWTTCEFRFRGWISEIEKLKAFLQQINIQEYVFVDVTDQIQEVRIVAEGQTNELIERFPTLKVAGLVENWNTHEVWAVLSDSGYSVITDSHLAGYFDGNHESRWEWEYDMMDSFWVHFDWLDINRSTEEFYYSYPFRDKWNRPFYVRENEGTIYIPQSTESEFQIKNGVLVAYLGSGGDVIIPETVTEIDVQTFPFLGNPLITSVYIPGTIKCIGNDTFRDCKNLGKIVLEEGVLRIDANAFSGCTALSEVILPNSLETIGDYAFNECRNLDVSRLFIPDPVRFESIYPFFGCQNNPDVLYTSNHKRLLRYLSCKAASFTVPDNVTEIGNFAFCAHRELTTVILPSSLKTIGDMAFSICINLEAISLPDSLQEIGFGAFRSCVSLKSIRIPGTVSVISDELLCDCGGLEEVILEEGISQIGTGAFSGCRELQKAHLPGSIQKKIRGKLFEKNKKLIIYGPANSLAEEYATSKKIPFAVQ